MCAKANGSYESCRLCGGHNLSDELTLGEYTILRCGECSVQFSDPQPDDETLAAIYSADYFFSDREGISSLEVSRLKQKTAKLYVDQILALRKNETGNRLLEIGCGTGDFLIQAKSAGFSVTGLEVSEHAVAEANTRLNSRSVVQGYIETAAFPASAFDVVVFSDVLEHVRDPKSFLGSVHHCLRPGGLAFIVTPSTDSWSRTFMGTRWMEYKVEHLFYFNRRSLNYVLGFTGFVNIEFHKNFKILSFEYVRGHFRRFPKPLWTPLVESFGQILPGRWASLPLKVVASGVIATATKSLSETLAH